MEYHRDSRGWPTFLEHWGMVLLALVAFVLGHLALLLVNLNGQAWIHAAASGLGLLVAGGALILSAKLPLYRQGRLLTFGAGAIPPSSRGRYRWGWRLSGLGVLLSLGLLLSSS
ncbi:MAG TPA: hypothetical protein PKE47_13765 [Verrucomicrobiota bacterium]|nr:hypothetical protein [Verrucomicrobiota bacterium]